MFRWWTEGGRDERLIEAVFRIGVAGCFIGHGAFGILGKEAWLPYFAVAGIPESWAWALMPVVGALDIAVGILALITPRPVVLAYMVGWALWTATLRPFAGESVFEVLERAGNYGLPLAFLVAVGFGARGWLRSARIGRLDAETRQRVSWVLRGTVALLLVGHGGLAVQGKPLLAAHLSAVAGDASLLATVGWAEILLGLTVAVRPAPALLGIALVWKLATEALYPLTGAPFWEFVERAGSYAAPLALLLLSPVVVRHLAPAREWAERAALILLAGMVAGVTPTPTLAAAPVTVQDPEVLEGLRAGELVLACRHAITDRSRGDSRSVDYDDPATQRVLSDEGRRQARHLGEVLRGLGAPIGEVLASPYARTMDSAQLGFGRGIRSDALVYGNRRAQRTERRRLLTEPTRNGNRVLMSHQGVLYSSLPGVERGSIREGDCVVVRPEGEGEMEILGTYGPQELAELARALSTVLAHLPPPPAASVAPS